jgi:hypothetical protein
MNQRERIARFLNLEAGHPLQVARIRGLRSVETAREFLKFEAEHQSRRSVVGAINRRVDELQRREAAASVSSGSTPVRADGGDETPPSAGEGCPKCGNAKLREVTVNEQDGLWCPECADFLGEA